MEIKMEFHYDDGCGNSICCTYWSEHLDSETIDKKYSKYDFLQVCYPKYVNIDIYNKYKEVLAYCEYDGRWGREAKSIDISLKQTEDEILEHMSKNTRYKVKRALERDGLYTELTVEIGREDMEEYIAFYNDFADLKDMRHIDENRVRALVEQGKYSISRCCDKTGKTLVEHAYYVDKEGGRVMLATSSSLFREAENSEYRNMIGRANRMLHFMDMVGFKKLGFITYDMGGAGDYNEELKAIADFKLGFGGEVIKYDAGFTIPLKYVRQADKLLENAEQYAGKKIVIYGYGQIGRYIAEGLKKREIADFIILDNYLNSIEGVTLCKDADLERMDSNTTVLFMTLGKSSFSKAVGKLEQMGYEGNRNMHTVLF